MSGEVDHILLTRFNLPSTGVESTIRAQEGWLRGRVALFERYTVPSVEAQTCRDFRWLVYFDPCSPGWLMEWLRAFEKRGLFRPVLRESVSSADVVIDATPFRSSSRGELITTNLDNDDGLAIDFVRRIQEAKVANDRTAIYLTNGLIVSRGALYFRRDRLNAFCSVRERWEDPVTCWTNWHNLLPETMPAVQIGGPPAWLQVVHGNNVSNRVRGRLVSPQDYSSRFGALLDDATEPSIRQRLGELLIHQPLREIRDGSRTAGKAVIMRWGGKEGLDRVKMRLNSRGSTLKREGVR